jgi:molybdopterin synthase catalytic subunit
MKMSKEKLESCFVKVKLFAYCKKLVGKEEIKLELGNQANVADLKKIILKKYPQLSSLMPSCIVAVNHTVGNESTMITHQDEVALFPPVSGG